MENEVTKVVIDGILADIIISNSQPKEQSVTLKIHKIK